MSWPAYAYSYVWDYGRDLGLGLYRWINLEGLLSIKRKVRIMNFRMRELQNSKVAKRAYEWECMESRLVRLPVNEFENKFPGLWGGANKKNNA